MAHRRTMSSRFPQVLPASPDSPPLTPIPNIASFPMSLSPPRKHRVYRYCTTFLSLFVLLALSVYVVFLSQPALRSISLQDKDSQDSGHILQWTNEAFRLAALKHRNPNSSFITQNARPQISLNQTQELAAVSSFIASLPQNTIPSAVDPSHTIDPQLILDFDTRGPHAREELQAVIDDVWTRNPVMLYSKVHSPAAREVKRILAHLNLRPVPTIVEVDERPDEAVLVPLLFRLTSMSELPILLVGGQTVGEAKQIKSLAENGVLQKAITQAGAIIDGGRKKKAKKL